MLWSLFTFRWHPALSLLKSLVTASRMTCFIPRAGKKNKAAEKHGEVIESPIDRK